MKSLQVLLVLLLGALPIVATSQRAAAQQFKGTQRIEFEARMTDDGAAIEKGIEWRIFSTVVDEQGELSLLAQSDGGSKAFDVTPGDYFVHAGYGYASAIRKISVAEDNQREIFTFDAGALQLSGVTGTGGRIPRNLLRFDIYEDRADERGVRKLIAHNIRPGEILPFPAGTYHVVSQYGRLNAEIRADLRVEPGKITQANIEHRAARMTFRLVDRTGGDAIADTAWSILTEAGDVITESSSAFPAFVLSEGTYTAIARNNEKIYSRDFKVISGINQDVELLIE